MARELREWPNKELWPDFGPVAMGAGDVAGLARCASCGCGVRAAGLCPKCRRLTVKRERAERLRAMLAAGMTLEYAAEHLGISVNTAKAALNDGQHVQRKPMREGRRGHQRQRRRA